MPLYDRACRECAWSRDDCYEPREYAHACPNCGGETARVWKSSRANLITDEQFIGGKTFENIDHEPITVYSRQQLRRELEARGLREFVRHVGEPGSDKSKHTSRWV